MNERELRELLAAVKRGRVSRRAFVYKMVALGLTAPFASRLLAHAGVAQAATPAEYKPTKAGGGGALKTSVLAGPDLAQSAFRRRDQGPGGVADFL